MAKPFTDPPLGLGLFGIGASMIDNTFIAKRIAALKPKLSDSSAEGLQPGTVFKGAGDSKRLVMIKTYPEKSEYIKVADSRIVDGVTGSQIKDNNRFNVNADKQVIVDIASAAKKHGVDPYTAVAMALQETGLSSYGDNEGNPLHAWGDVNIWGKDNAENVHNTMKALKEKFDYANRLGKKTEAERIQAWNGYGKVGKTTEGRQNSFYGIDVSNQPLDLNANPVYGKRVIDLRDNVIRKNPSIVQIIESTK